MDEREKKYWNVAREIVVEQINNIFQRFPEIGAYEHELKLLYAVEPMIMESALQRAVGEIITAPESEKGRLKRKYMLTERELEQLRRIRGDSLRGINDAVKTAVEIAKNDDSLKTFAARKGISHGKGVLKHGERKILVGSSLEAQLHELGHGLPAAYLMKEQGLPMPLARARAAGTPPEEDEAFAFAVAHHYLQKEVDDNFFKRASEKYGKKYQR